jgi:hypothetical protein
MAEKNSSNGVGLGTVLFLIFLILKLTNTIDWSWWWVTSPLWIPAGILLIIFGLLGILTYKKLKK